MEKVEVKDELVVKVGYAILGLLILAFLINLVATLAYTISKASIVLSLVSESVFCVLIAAAAVVLVRNSAKQSRLLEKMASKMEETEAHLRKQKSGPDLEKK
jgi:hypothetical protein